VGCGAWVGDCVRDKCEGNVKAHPLDKKLVQAKFLLLFCRVRRVELAVQRSVNHLLSHAFHNHRFIRLIGTHHTVEVRREITGFA
jgi:hypothetical protein